MGQISQILAAHVGQGRAPVAIDNEVPKEEVEVSITLASLAIHGPTESQDDLDRSSQDGTETHEGFVSNGLKFVDRMGFSRQNLAGR